MADGWVKLHRRLLHSSMMKNPKLTHFWIWCLLRATHTSVKVLVGYEEVELSPGQLIFGRVKAAAETGLAEQEIRTCVKALKSTKSIEVTTHSTRQFSIITITKWADYQIEKEESNQPFTMGQPTSNQRPTTNNNAIEQKETTYSACDAFETANSPTYQFVLDTYREVSGRKSVSPNDKAGARTLAQAIDAGELDRKDLATVIKSGLSDQKLPNQTLRGIANNYTIYLPAKTAPPRPGEERRIVTWKCPECGHIHRQYWSSPDEPLPIACQSEDGCTGRMEPAA